MTALQLISHHLCPYVQRAAITLKEKGIEHERIDIDLSAKPDWFLRISPLGKVPVLRAGEAVLFESSPICEYLDEITSGSLHPGDPLERARHRGWMAFASATLDAIAAVYNAPDATAFAQRCASLRERLAWLDRNLGEGPYFCGPDFHLVDAAWAPVFRYFDTFEDVAGLQCLDGLKHAQSYRAALAQRPSVRSAVSPQYPAMLRDFLARRGSHLSAIMREAA